MSFKRPGLDTALPEGVRGSAVALGLMVLLLIVIWSLVLKPAMSWYLELRGEIADTAFQLAKFSALADRLPTLKTQLTHLEAENTLENLLLHGSRHQAEGQLQQTIKAALKQADAQVVRMQAQPPRSDDTLMAVRVTVQIEVASDRLAALLASLSDHRPLVFVERLQIERQFRTRGSRPLKVRLTASGLRSTSERSTPRAR